jgi:myo-inositol 2-dehydrogenase/D-chiro-inositol 1-dehydrogenase
MSGTLRIGFAGAGFIAGIHAGVLGAQPGTDIAAVYDVDPTRAESMASDHGARAVPSFEALLEEADVLYICAPNAFHANMAIAALEAGRHVFSEKPIATSVADARRVRQAAELSRSVYQVGFNKRFAPAYLELKRRIDAGVLTPRWASLKMNRGELQQPAWVGDESLTGGFLYETPIHILDLGCWLFGPAREVVCRAAASCSGQLDDFAMLLTFESGVTATLCSSAHATWLYPFERVEVYGDHTTAVTEEMDRVTFQLGLETESETLDVHELPVPERWGYAAEDTAFLAAVRGDREPAVSAAVGDDAAFLVDACYRAAASGAPVTLQ